MLRDQPQFERFVIRVSKNLSNMYREIFLEKVFLKRVKEFLNIPAKHYKKQYVDALADSYMKEKK